MSDGLTFIVEIVDSSQYTTTACAAIAGCGTTRVNYGK